MPDRNSPTALDVRLARGRADLLDTIDQPPLALIRARATARRRRRHGAMGGGGLLAVALAATLIVRPWAGADDQAPPPVAEPRPSAPVYSADGITINGLTDTGVLQLPGTVIDVEFTDPDHGFLLATCSTGQPCPATVARTDDGGVTWRATELPGDTVARTGLDLVASTGGRLVVASDRVGYASADGGQTWQSTVGADVAVPTRARAGDLLRLGPGSGRCRGAVEVWTPGHLRAGVTQRPPGIDVCWVAPVATADGAWWAGGVRDGRAALAVTKDLGASWLTVPLDAPDQAVTSVEVATLGSHAYAVVLGPDRAITALFHSADSGRTFSRTASGGGGPQPHALAGAMVPLLDGRLLVTGTDHRWYVSADDGRTFSRADGNLPAVARLARTTAGYVAYDLFGGGWAAFSSDGSTWRKLQIN